MTLRGSERAAGTPLHSREPLMRCGLLGLVAVWIAVSQAVPLRGQNPEEPPPVPGFQRDQAYLGSFPFEHIVPSHHVRRAPPPAGGGDT